MWLDYQYRVFCLTQRHVHAATIKITAGVSQVPSRFPLPHQSLVGQLCFSISRPCSVESARLLGAPLWLQGWACWGPICCNLPGPLLPQMWWLRALWEWNSWWRKEMERRREREQSTSLLLMSSHGVWECGIVCANGTNYAPESTADGLVLEQNCWGGCCSEGHLDPKWPKINK